MLVMAVRGAVGGVKVDVYTAVPLTTRKLERYPTNGKGFPTVNRPICAPLLYDGVPLLVAVPPETPFTQIVYVFPLLVPAM